MNHNKAAVNAIRAFYDVVEHLSKVTEVLDQGAETPTSRFIYACTAALIERAEAVVQLYQTGHQHSADMIIRNISEISVHLSNVYKEGQEYLDRLRISTLNSYRGMYRYIIKHSSQHLSEQVIESFNAKSIKSTQLINELQQSRGWPPKSNKQRTNPTYILTIAEAFEKANMTEDYIVYKYLCQRTHVDLYTLNKDHTSEITDFGFIDVGKPLSTAELSASLEYASEMLIHGLTTALKHFGKDESIIGGAITAHRKMLAELSSKSE